MSYSEVAKCVKTVCKESIDQLFCLIQYYNLLHMVSEWTGAIPYPDMEKFSYKRRLYVEYVLMPEVIQTCVHVNRTYMFPQM